MKSLNSRYTRGGTRVCTLLLALMVLASVSFAQTFTSGEKER